MIPLPSALFSRTLLAVALATTTLSLSVACSKTCEEMKTAYQSALAAEPRPVPGTLKPDGGPLHLGVAARLSLVDEGAQHALTLAFTEALRFTEKVGDATQDQVDVRLEGVVTGLKLTASDACPSCVRLQGALGGQVWLKVPILGERAFPLAGQVSLVLPLQLGPGKTSAGALILDPKLAAEVNRSELTVQIEKLPPPWSGSLEKALAQTLLKVLGERVAPVTLVEIDPPDVGIQGVEILPTTVVTDAKEGTLFIGMTSNLPPAKGKPKGLARFTAIPAGSNLSVAVDPAILVPILGASMEAGLVSRGYTLEGADSAAGPLFMTLSTFSTEQTPAGGGDNPFEIGLRLWSLGEEGPCFWADTQMAGALRLDRGQIELDVKEAKLTETSMPDAVVPVANWGSAAFLGIFEQTLRDSLAPEVFAVPGAKLAMRYDTMSTEGGAIRVGITASLKTVSTPPPAGSEPQTGGGGKKKAPRGAKRAR